MKYLILLLPACDLWTKTEATEAPSAYLDILCADLYCESLILDGTPSTGGDLTYTWTVDGEDLGEGEQLAWAPPEGIYEVELAVSNDLGEDSIVAVDNYTPDAAETVFQQWVYCKPKSSGSYTIVYKVGGCVSPTADVNVTGFRLSKKTTNLANTTMSVGVLELSYSATDITGVYKDVKKYTSYKYTNFMDGWMAMANKGALTGSSGVVDKTDSASDGAGYIYMQFPIAAGDTANFAAWKQIPNVDCADCWYPAPGQLISATCPDLSASSVWNNTGDLDDDGTDYADDCDDSNSAVYPGATEDAENGIDDDCDGFTDETDEDADGDGYTVDGGDCNDADPDIHPGATETEGDGLDSDCDGSD